MIQRLRLKFMFINMLIVLVMLGIIFSMIFYFTKTNLEQESIQRMRTVASNLFQPSPDHSFQNPSDDIPDPFGFPYFLLQKTPSGDVAVIGNYGELSAESLKEILEAASLEAKENGILSQYQLRFCKMAAPVTPVFIFADSSGEQAMLQNLIRSCFFIGIIGFAAFFFISLFWAYWTVLPVETAWKQQRQFIADASHELKTPLAVIMTNAELLQDKEQSDKNKQQFSDNILTMAQQMRRLTEGLLELARFDKGDSKTTFTEINFSQFVSDAILPFEPLYFEKGLELHTTVEDALFIKGNTDQLNQVIDILLDNALKYAAPQSIVSVQLKRHGIHGILSVESQGETISRDDLNNIFKRFYRIDKARSMNQSYGLGLPIAEHIVKEHHGEIWAESDQGINTFLVKLSLQPFSRNSGLSRRNKK